MKLSHMKKSETTEQILLFSWARGCEDVLPCLSLLYHVPNEGKRTNGNLLKAAGLKSGVPDICLPVAKGAYHGLYIEMKYGKNRATKAQAAFLEGLRRQGYKAQVCYGFEEAKEAILFYLQEPRNMPLQRCIDAPWADGKCAGVLLPQRVFIHKDCRACEKHRPTQAEQAVMRQMEAAQDFIKETILNILADLSEGVPMPETTLEGTLEAVNHSLALLVKKKQLSVEQSAAVLSIAMDIYEQAKKKG